MATKTTNLGLTKPAGTEKPDISVINDNMNKIDTAVARKAIIKQLTNEDLNNVTTPGFYNAGGGNSVTHKPTNIDNFGLEVIHIAAGKYYTQKAYGITTQYTRRCNNGSWSNWVEDKLTDTTYSDATQSTNGLMPVTDKKKLDTFGEIELGADITD